MLTPKPYMGYFKEVKYFPNGNVYGDGELIDRVKPSLYKTVWIETNPTMGLVPHMVTI